MPLWKEACLSFVVMAITAHLVISPRLAPAQSGQDETTFEDVQREMRELRQALREYGVDRRDKAIERSQSALEALDQRLEKLEASVKKNWDAMSVSARERSEASLRELRRQRIELAEKYGKMKIVSEEAWESIRTGFLGVFSSLNESWENTLRELQKFFD